MIFFNGWKPVVLVNVQSIFVAFSEKLNFKEIFFWIIDSVQKRQIWMTYPIVEKFEIWTKLKILSEMKSTSTVT